MLFELPPSPCFWTHVFLEYLPPSLQGSRPPFATHNPWPCGESDVLGVTYGKATVIIFPVPLMIILIIDFISYRTPLWEAVYSCILKILYFTATVEARVMPDDMVRESLYMVTLMIPEPHVSILSSLSILNIFRNLRGARGYAMVSGFYSGGGGGVSIQERFGKVHHLHCILVCRREDSPIGSHMGCCLP